MEANCPVCQQELGHLELSLNQSYHFDCRKCAACDNEISIDLMTDWLEGKGTREHPTCRDRRLEKELLTKEVTITQAHLDYLNRLRLIAWVNDDLDIAGNSQEAERALHSMKVHEMKLETMYKFLAKYQTLAAMISISIAENKNKTIQKASIEYREKTQYEKEQERAKNLTEEKRKSQLQAERLDPKLRDERKAIEAMMKTFGLSRETVMRMMEEERKKKEVQK